MLCLPDNCKREKYSKIQPDHYLIPHLGQRKLLIAEIAFLVYNNNCDTIVYAGAGPGVHMKEIAVLFPKKMFYLYDPRPFAPELKDFKNLVLFQDYFTDESASYYGSKFKNVLFISDIRTSGNDFEGEVMFNLTQQMKWCELIKPYMASLKFRLPFNCDKSIKYYDGQIRLQAWVGIDSAETRLWTNCQNLIEYDCKEYEEKMFYFNKHLRLGDYNEGQCKPMDFCNDCAIEWLTWQAYAEKYGKTSEWCCDQVVNNPQSISIGPHGKYRDMPIHKRLIELREEATEFHKIYNVNEEKRDKVNKAVFRKKK